MSPIRKTASIFALVFLFFCDDAFTTASGNGTENRNLDFFEFRTLITSDFLEQHLSVFSSDSLMGRGTGQAGIRMAADYLANQLAAFDVTPLGDDGTYFQHFNLEAERTREIIYSLKSTADADSTTIWTETASSGSPARLYNEFAGEVSLSGGISFAGLGIRDPESETDHLADAGAAGNWVLIFRDYHEDAEKNEHAESLLEDRISNLLFRERVRGVLVIEHFDSEIFTHEALRRSTLIGKPTAIRLPDRGGRGSFSTGVKSVHPELAADLLGLDSVDELRELHSVISTDPAAFRGSRLPYYLSSEAARESITLQEKNVLGFVEGCHPELKEEVIVMTAHYDHMGIGQPDETGDMIFNGADDNGSGTVTTLAMANTIKQAKEQGYCLDRSILFLFVAAEEHGLLGSRYYSDNPVIPIEQTVANFNLDMFGRIDYEYEETGKDYIYIIGAEIISSDLDQMLKQANSQTENLILDMRYNDLDDRNQFYRRSDHWNFGRLQVPFIFFFSGLHDNYHLPSDTIDLIPFDLLEKRARLIFATLVEVANAPERPVVDNQQFIQRTRGSR